MGELTGKVAIVTGASKGIGAGIAKGLAEAGAAVVVNYASSRAGADRVVSEIVDQGGRAIAVQGDVARAVDVRRLFEETRKAFGSLDVLVNNAGVFQFEPLEAVTEDEFHREFNTNVLGPILTIQEAVKHFGPHGGSVINISSVASTRATPNAVVYSATTSDTFSVVTTYLGPNKAYEWTVTATDLAGHARLSREKFRFTTGATTDVAIPPSASRVLLHQNRPNPAQRSTDIPFTLAGGGGEIPVTLRIFDPAGRLVRTLVDGPEATARHYVIRWDGEDQLGRRAASGIYYYQLRAGSVVQTRRMVLLR